MVTCCLWFPDAGGPFDTVYLTSLEAEEWTALAEWARPRHREFPVVAYLLSGPLPTEIVPSNVQTLFIECKSVDWDSLNGLALNGFACLSLSIDQAAAQERAGLRFASEDIE